jgi:6-phosphogluconolactonase/glucosamine-6-phosphate isomerase/deaminase
MEEAGESTGFRAGLTEIRVERDEAAMGAATARFIASAMKRAAERGERPALWLMAAPSAFAFYAAFAELASKDSELAALCREAAWFQFDDYPIGRGDPRFPITFRHLLETRFFGPMERICGRLKGLRLLEIGGPDDDRVCADYARSILEIAEDPRRCLIQLKGIGMDGHWGFHGHETPLDAAPAVIRVAMNAANIHQQKLDWPEYFREDADLPRYARTCTVSLFMKARVIVDDVPQASKIYSVLAAYGNDKVRGCIPSSALKTHPDSHAFLTRDSAWALMEYRRALALDPEARLNPSILGRLDALWSSDPPAARAAASRSMRAALEELGMLPSPPRGG